MTVRLKKRANLGRFQNLTQQEHDSCGIVAIIEKDGKPKRENLLDSIDALIKMEHRSGFIQGEGDGCGILTDIPRKIWAKELTKRGYSPTWAEDPRFVVAHLFLPKQNPSESEQIRKRIIDLFSQRKLRILTEKLDQVNHLVLGPHGQKEEPHFWQISALAEDTHDLPRRLFDLTIEIEQKFSVQVASCSNCTAVYKLMGAASLLLPYFRDLNDSEFESLVTIGHNRYSTNTLSNFYRVQPFSILGHNGEINTIAKLREEAKMLRVPLTEDGSDSQDLNRLIETLIHHYGFSLFEAIEMVFPPILHELNQLPDPLKDLYTYFRQTWGPFAQGPAGIVSRYDHECAFSVDALGLRPLWMIESERSLCFSSEQGIIPATEMVSEPKPLAPGETIGIQLTPQAHVLTHDEIQQIVYERISSKQDLKLARKSLSLPRGNRKTKTIQAASIQAYTAFGWDREQIQFVEQMAVTGIDPIRSLGHDAPLAALSKERQNIADFIKESVAVVTNPAIDREREMEHFSTRVVLGVRPGLTQATRVDKRIIELPSPILAEGNLAKEITKSEHTLSLEQLLEWAEENKGLYRLPLFRHRDTSYNNALKQLSAQAISAVKEGAYILLLDDDGCHENDQLYLDPHLAISCIDQALKHAPIAESDENLRRQVSIVVRSASIRNLHDLAVAIGLGADAISPYLMFATIAQKEKPFSPLALYHAINKGLEKIISTIGIHELRGYARLFSSIGLDPEIAEILQVINYCGSSTGGLNWTDLENDAEARYIDYRNEKAKPARLFHLWPRIWKSIGQLASGDIQYREFAQKLDHLEKNNPLCLRHVVDLKTQDESLIKSEEVDLSIKDHTLPFVISSMSFGSQNEIAFRAYAEAADRLNMISLNGEGGEIKDMMGKYPHTRGHQVASGRFGVNVELVNSANFLEIKIGQGAKPGEGGHLPGKKVSSKVAAARNATPGSDLISPSNNHDIYSIEDLAQIITELKTANPKAKVIVKVPIVPNIGTISVGIAKAGADIITLSGFDGGTGAARIHALQHVGLPAEIGVKAAHQALMEAGIRNQVELWADGGVRSAKDVVKLMLLGANRIGFGTLAMLAIGCTTCRGCHLDTCHVGIATQIESIEEAKKHGLRRFVPRDFDASVASLIRLFTSFADETKRLTAALGFKRTQDLVGRSDLLIQTRAHEQLDLTDLLSYHPIETPASKEAAMDHRALVKVGTTSVLSTDWDTKKSGQYILSNIHSKHRVLLSDFSGERIQGQWKHHNRQLPEVQFTFAPGSIPGNGFAAFNGNGIRAVVYGGAQDGVGKTAYGGQITILKTRNKHGIWINGSVGKGFCYGAQKGLFIVQGNADSRAGIRLSGADIIIGGDIKETLKDGLGFIGHRANIKGFAFEYMTDGRAVVLGDPGPWICSGMTGGVVYQRLQPELGLDEAAIKRRIAKAAKVVIEPLSEKGRQDLQELLSIYQTELFQSEQYEEANKIKKLLHQLDQHFIQIIPIKQQADSSISTE